ncbi:hypothetical protein VTN77DRAFT_4539 [Rasamsonia byssochlamydoides]|uniref:uncharacterized protein n=1 Tax=Rasamsonia byssochlamydoides TaxID=89139 RepID=UPI00374399B9
MAGNTFPEYHHPSSESSAVAPQKAKKRSRVQFSCTACRYRKLKCDRTYPCDRCTRRGDAASCTYIGHGPRGRASHGSASPTHIQNRIQHLENLVLSFAQKKKLEEQATSQTPHSMRKEKGSLGDPESYLEEEDHSNAVPEEKQPLEDSPGKLLVEEVGTSYVDAAHWRAILEDIKEVKEYLREDDETSEDSEIEPEMDDSSRPSLLFGLGKPPSKEELLADIPPRPVADRLIARFLNSGDPSLVIIHFPTFQREYAQFWLDPQSVSVSWLALLYACMAMAAGVYYRSGDPLPSPLGNSLETMVLFRRRCCHCLIHANYTKPGRYKVEALMMYAAAEYSKKGNAPVSVSIILGITIQLAMRMGYHRDSKHYNNISAMEGEMRRRVWAGICQLDALTAFQVGIPKQTQSWQCDTELPRNLLDEDFDENTAELPPSRPDTERTPVAYTISKARIMSVFGRISDLAYSRKPPSYDEVLELDRRLEEAHESITLAFRMRPINQSITDAPDLIMQRYTLDVLYQKARIVLHRKYLTEVRSDLRHTYSRWACVNAAKEILRHQADLFHESQPGGRLDRDRWFFTSLQNHDFLLAAMIICLELSQNRPSQTQTRQPGYGFTVVLEGRDDLLRALETSRDIWKVNLRHSVEARNAFNVLTIMLKKAQRGEFDAPETDSSSFIGKSYDDVAMGESASTSGMANGTKESETSYPLGILPTPISNSIASVINDGAQPATGEQLHPASLDIIQGMIDAPSGLDWHVWDGYMQDFEPGFMDQFWGPNPVPADYELFHTNSKNTNGDGNNGDGHSDGRTLRATRTLPFPPAPLFDIIASVESYCEFLPFLTASTVTARDPATGYPTRAFLTVGYGPFSETFTSRVDCDRNRWIVEARSGGGKTEDGQPVPGEDEGLFNYLCTRWELIPLKQEGQQQETKVQLEIRFRFQNPLHTAMMSAVEDKVAGVMIEAFEKRIRERMAKI